MASSAGQPIATAGPTSAATLSADARTSGYANPDLLVDPEWLTAHLSDPKVRVVALTPRDEYLRGHIPGAVNVNYPLTAAPQAPRYFKTQAELEQLYASQGVTPDKEAIPYCSTGVRSAVTYFTLKLIGYPDVRLYTGSWAEWGNRDDLPIER